MREHKHRGASSLLLVPFSIDLIALCVRSVAFWALLLRDAAPSIKLSLNSRRVRLLRPIRHWDSFLGTYIAKSLAESSVIRRLGPPIEEPVRTIAGLLPSRKEV